MRPSNHVIALTQAHMVKHSGIGELKPALIRGKTMRVKALRNQDYWSDASKVTPDMIREELKRGEGALGGAPKT
jgi:hypothetical protein